MNYNEMIDELIAESEMTLEECREDVALFIKNNGTDEVLDHILSVLYREMDMITERIEALEGRYV